jgi:hypothetical protein
MNNRKQINEIDWEKEDFDQHKRLAEYNVRDFAYTSEINYYFSDLLRNLFAVPSRTELLFRIYEVSDEKQRENARFFFKRLIEWKTQNKSMR